MNLSPALHKSLANILKILDCTLLKLIQIMEDSYSKSKEFDFDKDLMFQEEPTVIRKKLEKCNGDEPSADRNQYAMLSHSIIELLNTIEAGSKSSVIPTPEVSERNIFAIQVLKLFLR